MEFDASTQRPQKTAAVANETERRREDRRAGERRSNFDRRRGPGIRRTEFRRAAEEGHMNEEQLDFLKAMEAFKVRKRRAFPAFTDILDVLLSLGYRKVAPVGEFALTKARSAQNAAADDEADVTHERSGLDRRNGDRRAESRRLSDEPACGGINAEQLAFIRAIDEYKRVNDRPFPTLTEMLDVLMYLGYRKVEESHSL